MNPAQTNEQIIAYYVSLLIQKYCGQTSPQIITFSQVPAAGSFTFTYGTLTVGGNGQTGGIPWNATNSNIAYAFENEVFAVSSDPNNPETYSGSSKYNPAFSPNALAVWEADFNITTGTTFSWVDKTTRALVASQATSADQPSVLTNQLNGLPVIHFTPDTTKYLTIPVPILNATSTPFSIYFVIRPSSANLAQFNNVISFAFENLTDDNLLLGFNSNVSEQYAGAPYWGGSNTDWNPSGEAYVVGGADGSFVYNTSGFEVWCLTYDGSGLTTHTGFNFIQNGINLGSKQSIGGIGGTSSNIIGDSMMTGTPGYDLYGFYIFDDILSGSELNGFQSYILNKLGLTT